MKVETNNCQTSGRRGHSQSPVVIGLLGPRTETRSVKKSELHLNCAARHKVLGCYSQGRIQNSNIAASSSAMEDDCDVVKDSFQKSAKPRHWHIGSHTRNLLRVADSFCTGVLRYRILLAFSCTRDLITISYSLACPQRSFDSQPSFVLLCHRLCRSGTAVMSVDICHSIDYQKTVLSFSILLLRKI